MEPFPIVNEDCTKLYQMIMAPIKSQIMMTALELEIYDRLSEFTSADAVAQSFSGDPENTRRLLDGLVMIDLLEKKDGLYRNLPPVQSFLTTGSPTFLGDLFLDIYASYPVLFEEMTYMVQKGSFASDEAGEANEEAGEADEANEANEANEADEADEADEKPGIDSELYWAKNAKNSSGRLIAFYSHIIADTIRRLPEFPSLKKMLDLGGGSGILGIAMVNAHPSMRGVIFDHPPVAKVAESFIRRYGLEDRMEALAGDFTEDSIGEDYDLIFASAALNFHDLDDSVKKIYDALKPGGLFLSLAEGLTDERTKPISTLGYIALMMQAGTDFLFEQGEIADAMIRAGFKSVRSRTLDTPSGPIDLDIARK